MTTQKIRGKIQTRIYLDDLIDVSVPTIKDGQTIKYNSSMGLFIPAVEDGWFLDTNTWTRTSDTTATIISNEISKYKKGAKLAIEDGSTKYFYIADSSWNNGTITITLAAGSDYVLAGNPYAIYISYQATPQQFPHWFNYVPEWTGFATAPVVENAMFSIEGGVVNVIVDIATAGVSNDTILTCSLPVGSMFATKVGVASYAEDNSTILTTPARLEILDTTLTAYTNMASGAWTGSNNKQICFNISYGIYDFGGGR